MKNCIIMRGVSGAGKNHWIQNLIFNLEDYGYYHIDIGLRLEESADSVAVVSADDYFVDSEGVYRFDANMLGAAHTVCMQNFLRLVATNIPLVVVNNTNISAWEIAPYMSVAAVFDYKATIIELDVNPETCAQRNQHAVSAVQIGAMNESRRRETLPPMWKRIIIRG